MPLNHSPPWKHAADFLTNMFRLLTRNGAGRIHATAAVGVFWVAWSQLSALDASIVAEAEANRDSARALHLAERYAELLEVQSAARNGLRGIATGCRRHGFKDDSQECKQLRWKTGEEYTQLTWQLSQLAAEVERGCSVLRGPTGAEEDACKVLDTMLREGDRPDEGRRTARAHAASAGGFLPRSSLNNPIWRASEAFGIWADPTAPDSVFHRASCELYFSLKTATCAVGEMQRWQFDDLIEPGPGEPRRRNRNPPSDCDGLLRLAAASESPQTLYCSAAGAGLETGCPEHPEGCRFHPWQWQE